MKKISIILIYFLFILSAVQVFASDEENAIQYSALEFQLYNKINSAREAPLDIAASFGIDLKKLQEQRPEFYDMLASGMPSLIFNSDLQKAAAIHTADMLENGYYSHESIDHRSYEDRIKEAGFIPQISAESIGMTLLTDDIEYATDRIFEKMFIDALDEEVPYFAKGMLNPDLKEVGIGFGSGVMEVSPLYQNGEEESLFLDVYIVTCDFGTSAISEPEQILFNLINRARKAPLDMAAALGLDPECILAELPDMSDILKDGLPPLTFNMNLYAAATAHTLEMMEHQYYSYDSKDGRTFEDRIKENGYIFPSATGESLGMLGFANFIEPEEAVTLIFKNMFKEELKPERTEKRNILDPNLKEIGAAFASGTIEVDEAHFNSYIATCDFAATPLSKYELEFMRLLNEARQNPLKMAEHLGMDTDKILEDFPNLQEELEKGLPPLLFNSDLYNAAGSHAYDMITNGYVSHISLDGRTPNDRILESGYPALFTGERYALNISEDYINPAEALDAQFKQIFKQELLPDCKQRYILNPEIQDIGIRFILISPEISTELAEIFRDSYTILMVADFGRKNIENP